MEMKMEKKQPRLSFKKTQAFSVQGKTMEKGGKVGKAKTNGMKSKIKSLPGKRKPTRVPKKTKPAPHVEPGYALYSSLSEESSTQETCVRLLNQLKEKKKTDMCHHTQFNTRLSSSTPDPDRLLVEFDQQLIPERDTSSPLWKTILTAKHVAAKKESYPILNQGQFSNQWSTEGTNHLVRVPTALSVPREAPAYTGSDQQQTPITPHNQSVAVTQTFSQGFVPIGVGNDSDQDSLQQFPEIVPSGLTFNAGIHSDNHTTPDTSRSGYVNLPKPALGTAISSQQSVIPLYTQQNGLYQLRPQSSSQPQVRSQALSQPQVRPQFLKDQTFQSCDIPDLPHGGRLFEQFACGELSYPSPVPDNLKLHQLEGSYLLTQEVIPERDTVPFTVPSLHLSGGQIETNLQDTLSTITGPGNQSPDTARTLTSSGSPRSNQQVTPKNSSGSSSSKSVHFQIKDDLVKDLSEISKTSHQTQTDSGCLSQQIGTDHQFISVEVPAATHSSPNSSVQTDQNTGKSGSEHENHSQMVTSSVKSDVPNPWSGVKAKAGMKKLRYCLNELKECGKINKDKEIKRLVKEVEDTLEIIPQLKSTFSLQAEIDLAIQPLRSENAQLRRRLRLLNKQSRVTSQPTKEMARTDDSQLQTKTAALQKKLVSEKEEKVKLAAEMKDMHTQMQKMKVERSRLIASVSEKETDELMIRQECLSDAHQFRTDLDRLQRQIKGARIQYEALERENHILQVTLQQKDDEIKDQKNRIEAIKDAVGQVLQELEAGGAGAETSFISNNSFSLQRLLHILGGKQTAGFENSVLSDAGVQSVPNVYKSHLRTSTLTAESLATHNRLQQPARSSTKRYEEDRAPGDYKSSMSDTEVEYQTFDSHKNTRRKSPSQRQRSLSGDGKPVEKNDHRMTKYSDCYGRDGSYLTGIQKKHDRSGNVFMAKSQKLRFEEDDTFHRSDYDNSRRYEETRSDLDTQSKFSMADSRYSVTDYFRKYPSSSLKFQSHSRNTFRTNDNIDASRISKPSIVPRHNDRHRSLSQPESSVLSRSDGPHFSSPQKPSSHQSTLTQHSITQKSMLSPQDQLYRGTYLDNSISAIDDDNISSVSGRSPSSMSVDERTFKKGIATLDANILKLQLALQKTKSMLY
ncbi:uncharacterized protein LOC130051762 isoform X2 [Ostrea edulis]|uniref:uncharacterized protein LOC130051762 isoform X2 n=1 Tax=Ostrea edulis TaxID=37623 RepID=UPI0024AF90C1|nr:uncharacterized protein LOC130051762 isoform X2 [Ostrea edulis]